jgi:flagellar biosynthetic protein FliP
VTVRRAVFVAAIAAALVLAGSAAAWAQAQGLPHVSVTIDQPGSPKETATSMQILILFTILSLAPAILISVTSFTRLIVVFSFLRQAMGTQQMPPNQVLVALALFLSFFIMSPVISSIDHNALKPMLAGQIDQSEAMSRGSAPLKEFMLTQTREKDLALFVQLAGKDRPGTKADLPLSVVIPSFMISELRTAFQIGFVVYLPFLIIDLIVSSVLMSMGMMMIPPAMISLPFKVLLFVLVDGWSLICHSLVRSFHL